VVAGGALVVEALTSKKAKRIALIGDSLAVGLGPPMAALAAQAGVPFKAEGHVGSTVAQWLSTPSWGSWVEAFAPSTTLIELGTNDYLNPSPSLAQYQQLAAKFPGAIWIAPPIQPANALTKVRAVIEQVGVPVIPAMTGLQFGPDGFHPLNYAPWAAWIWGQLP
jgi:hypothetical protein